MSNEQSVDPKSVRNKCGNEDLVNVKRSDVLDKMINSYLGGDPNSKSEYLAYVRKIVPFLTDNVSGSNEPIFPLSNEISVVDPFYNIEEDRERILNAGRINIKGGDLKVILFVEIPLLFEKLIKIDGSNSNIYSLHTLLRVEITEKEERKTLVNEAIIISFKDKSNLRYPYFLRYPKNKPVMIEEDVCNKAKVGDILTS